MAFLMALGAGLLLTWGDLSILEWTRNSHPRHFFSGLAIYTVALCFMILGCRYKHIAIVSVSMVVINVVSLLILSRILYGDRFSLAQLGGIGLGLLTISVLELAE
jgi:multidrug transporter EmrE-like cation transporter